MRHFLKQLRQDIKLVLSALQETAVEIADHVSQHVQQVKLNLNALDLGEEIRRNEVALGKIIYRYPDTPLLGLGQETNADHLIKKIDTAKKQLEASNAIVSPHEALHEFERLLIRSEFIIQQVVIPDGCHRAGKCIKDLDLPSQMLIFFIKKRNEVDLAYGSVMIEVQDEITFLCSKDEVKEYIAFWK